jgi:hypothetical protein
MANAMIVTADWSAVTAHLARGNCAVWAAVHRTEREDGQLPDAVANHRKHREASKLRYFGRTQNYTAPAVQR